MIQPNFEPKKLCILCSKQITPHTTMNQEALATQTSPYPLAADPTPQVRTTALTGLVSAIY